MHELTAFAVLAAVLVVRGLVRTGQSRLRRHGGHVLAWRWLTGAPWHGKPVTDAGWARPGTKALTPTGHATRWHHLPRWKRAAWRTGGTLAVLAALRGLLTAPRLTIGVAGVTVALALALACMLAVRSLLARKRRRTWLLPLHRAAHQIVGVPRAALASSWIAIDADRTRVELDLPQGWPADENDKKRLVAVVTAKTGIEAPDVSWRLAGPKPQLVLTASVPAPELVTFGEIGEAIERARPGEIVLGKGKGDKVITASLTLDSPHWGVSAESGAGKSITCRTIMCQVAHKGGILAVLDAPKRFSHQWCKGLPNVAYARTPAEAHDLLCWLQGETDRRNNVADVSADLEGNVLAKFDRIMFVIEEANALASRLRKYWAQIGGTGRSPAIDALEELLFLGRQVSFNGLLVGQRLSVKATGSGDSRENIGVKLLLNPSASTWKMLAPRFPQPPPDNTKGRAHLVTDEVREVQIAKFTAVEARDYATSGILTPCPAGMPGTLAVPGPIPIDGSGSDVGVVLKTRPVVLAPAGSVTLSEAVTQGFVSCSLHAIRKASQRPGFPQHIGMRGLAKEYDALALAEWDAVRR